MATPDPVVDRDQIVGARSLAGPPPGRRNYAIDRLASAKAVGLSAIDRRRSAFDNARTYARP
jgi:hypothetical protein